MKSKLKYYAQVSGVNLLAALVPILAVVLIYGLGKVKNIYTHPSVISQEIYNCCTEAVIVVLTGFSVGLLLLAWADNWRKAKLSALKVKREFEELGIHVVMKVEPIEERTEQENVPASDDSVFEDLSGLTVREIYQLYQGREVLITVGKNRGSSYARLACYDAEGPVLFIGFLKECFGPYSLDEINVMRGNNLATSYVEPIYKSYDCFIPSLIRIYK